MSLQANYSQLNNRMARMPYTAAPMSPMEILTQILERLEARGVPYAIIHGFAEKPDIRSDVDIAFENDPRDVMPPVLKDLVKDGKIRVVQCLYYEVPFGYYYVLQIMGTYPPEYLHLDCLYDPYGINGYYIPTPELVRNRVRESWGYRSADEKSALYLLVKKSRKGVLTGKAHTVLRKWFEGQQAHVPEIKELFGKRAKKHIKKLVEANDLTDVTRHLTLLRNLLVINFLFRHPFRLVRRQLVLLKRLLFRIMNPTGLFVILLGPDGCGKSTLARQAETDLENAYRKKWRFHWRPGLFPKPLRDSSSCATRDPKPPNIAKYGTFLSLLRFLYYLLDFILGYWLVIYPKKVRTTLILGERWYHDIIVNPQRYGFRLPRWLLTLGSKLIPSPDIVILFTADPSIIASRKPELSEKEIRNQIATFRSLTRDAGTFREIETGGEITSSIRDLEDHVLLKTAERTNHLFHLYPVDEWSGFPSPNNCKVLINKHDTFRNALQLYQPYSLLGRHSKHMAGAVPECVQNTLMNHCRVSGRRREKLIFYADVIREVLSTPHLVISFSNGTPGPHQKTTAQATQQKPVSYIKIGKGDIIGNLLDNESAVLYEIQNKCTEAFTVPRTIARVRRGDFHFLFLTAPDQECTRRPLMPDTRDLDFLECEIPAKPLHLPLQTILTRFDSNVRQVASMERLQKFLAESGIHEDILIGPAHGDYTPWNTFTLKDGSLYVYDWEYSIEAAPVLTDLFHRVFMPLHLILRMAPRKIIARVLSLPGDALFSPVIQHNRISTDIFLGYFLLYLLDQHNRAIGTNQPLADFLENCILEVLEMHK